ncbi:MAG TPA: superoxide dismutase family protein [Virgibacillus sp.]|nr:superoxide dismutase family protein [Virgibacillus sp.]
MRNDSGQEKVQTHTKYYHPDSKKYLYKQLYLIGIVCIFVILVGCDQKTARTVDMYNISNDMVGTVKLSEDPEGVNAKVKVEGLSPGFHGIHVHEYAKCSGKDFKDAGNHLNPQGKKHGLMNSKGAHLGDMPNIKADSNGKMKGEVTVIDATLKDGKNTLKGSSVVITEDADDGISQPSGKSGKRILCGTIDKKEKKGESPSDPTEAEK